MAIVKGAGLVMKAIIEEGDAEIAAKMQDLALAEGALPKHLHTAMFTQSADNRMLTNRYMLGFFNRLAIFALKLPPNCRTSLSLKWHHPNISIGSTNA